MISEKGATVVAEGRLTASLLVRFTPGQLERLAAYARREGVSMGAVVRGAVLIHVDREHSRYADPSLPALATLAAVEHLRFLVESFLPQAEERSARGRAVALDRLRKEW